MYVYYLLSVFVLIPVLLVAFAGMVLVVALVVLFVVELVVLRMVKVVVLVLAAVVQLFVFEECFEVFGWWLPGEAEIAHGQ